MRALLPLCVLLFCLLAVSCGAPEQNASSEGESVPPSVEVSLSDLHMTIGKGIARQLSAVGGAHLTWVSSDESVATVAPDGTVIGKTVGNCTVTARNEFGRSADCAVEVKKTCFITIDDGPNEWTDDLLDVLTEYDAHATFFVVGAYILEDAVAQIQAQGSVVGLHTYSHNYAVCYGSTTSYYYGLEVIGRRIEKVLGYRPNLIRFPGGTHNSSSDPLLMQRVANGAKDLGYRVFDWTATTGDTSETRACAAFSIENVKKDCTDDVEILLMHNKRFNVEALRTIIPYLREKGYVLETLDHYTEDSYMFTPRYSRTHR